MKAEGRAVTSRMGVRILVEVGRKKSSSGKTDVTMLDLMRAIEGVEVRQSEELSRLETRQSKALSSAIQGLESRLSTEIESVGAKVDRHDERFDRLEDRLAEHDVRFDVLEKKIDQVDKKVDRNHAELKARAQKQDTRISKLAQATPTPRG